MVEETKKYYMFRKNVPYYNVGVRRSPFDNEGIMLTQEIPTVRIEEKDLRDFKIANKRQITEGLIREIEDDALDWELTNTISDEEAVELVKAANFNKLKVQLGKMDSQPMVQKLLTIAQERSATKRVISAIQAQLDELTPEIDFAEDRASNNK